MRITCPNCNAQYEVGDEMIPVEGRDVQCSNCGTTWYQDRRAPSAQAGNDRADLLSAPPEMDEEDDEDEEDAPDPGPRRAVPPRPEPDQRTLDILREERAHEERLRADARVEDAREVEGPEAAPAPAPTSDPVPPPRSNSIEERDESDDPRARAAAERRRMAAAASLARGRDQGGRSPREARPASRDDPGYGAAPGKRSATEDDEAQSVRPSLADGSRRGTRRDLLPDIEEINSSLRPDERAEDSDGVAETEEPDTMGRSNGFRVGFLTIGGLILVGVGLYLFADPIAQAVPQTASPLATYVDWVDAQRVALATAAEALTRSIAPEG